MMNPDLLEPVLEKLGFSARPNPDLAGLTRVYAAWCRKVPFDNIQKRLFYSGPAQGPVPGHDSEDFFRNWLDYGTGGTCWANSNATHDLLEALGYPVVRAAATMLSAPEVQGPTHGTVLATLAGQQYLVDGSMLTERPVPVRELETREVRHPAERVRVERRDGQWHFRWHPAHRPDGLWCRIETIDVDLARFNQYHDQTRLRSNFNATLYVRTNRPEGVVTLALGERMVIGPDGQLTRSPLSPDQRVRSLVEEFGIAEELAARLPADEPLPSRPGGAG